VGLTGYESPAELDANDKLKATLEALRLKIGPLMNLGDVSNRTVPKMCLIAPPRAGGAISPRCFIPHRCHTSIGVLGAVSVATAAVLPGSICDGISQVDGSPRPQLSIEHPTGEFTVALELERQRDSVSVLSAAVLRTARWLADGWTYIPSNVWAGDKSL